MFVLPPVCLSFSCVSSCLCVCVCVRVSLLLNLLECAFYVDLFKFHISLVDHCLSLFSMFLVCLIMLDKAHVNRKPNYCCMMRYSNYIY